jgi:hypothetical protein
MRYWVYGVDGSSKRPREPLFIEADSEAAARARAIEEGMQVEEIEAVRPRSSATPPSEDQFQELFLGFFTRLRRALWSLAALRVVTFGAILILCVVLVVQVSYLHKQVGALRPTAESLWDYEVIDAFGNSSEMLAQIAKANQDGWELVGVASDVQQLGNDVRTRVKLIMRRPPPTKSGARRSD